MKDCSTCFHYKKNCSGNSAAQAKRKKLQESSIDCHEAVDKEKLDILNKRTNDLFSSIDDLIKS